ncbi:hypothetical protein RND81_03G159800 [Saponaria officinalis]|uniref:Uncharacterized protein n=1 Tax=Saponaria officinalis TaxID=3572 RepID=A0AAW1M8P6_SAPOF
MSKFIHINVDGVNIYASLSADYKERHGQLVEEGQPVDENRLFYDVLGGHKKEHVYDLGSAALLYYDVPSKGRSSQKASTYVLGIMSQMEALQKEAEEQRKYREKSNRKE